MSDEKVIAHCTPEIAAWIDPGGHLQAAGLLVVDIPTNIGEGEPCQPPS